MAPGSWPSAGGTTAEVGRFILGAGYRFDERTRFVSELEIEHAISSSSDPGEVEVEQAYVEREFTSGIRGKAGLFLIPSGLLNENHEPTRYDGVFRNLVETSIIPTTWREGGIAVQGNTAGGLRWNMGVTTLPLRRGERACLSRPTTMAAEWLSAASAWIRDVLDSGQCCAHANGASLTYEFHSPVRRRAAASI